MERVDGNAIAGMLGELFVHEMTSARCRCDTCGRVEAMGAEHVYAHPQAPGAVLRCLHCDNLMLVIAHVGGRWRLGSTGVTWIELGES